MGSLLTSIVLWNFASSVIYRVNNDKSELPLNAFQLSIAILDFLIEKSSTTSSGKFSSSSCPDEQELMRPSATPSDEKNQKEEEKLSNKKNNITHLRSFNSKMMLCRRDFLVNLME